MSSPVGNFPAAAHVPGDSITPLVGRAILASALISLVLFLSTYAFLRQGRVYQSPDETSNRIFTETFGTHAELWYENELLPLDDENLLHPRGVLTYRDKAVPFNFLGLPVIYGAFYSIVGDNVRYIAILFAVGTAFFLYRAALEMFNARFEDALASLIACTPLLYYFNRPYMNALPAITMFSLGIWMLARFAKKPGAGRAALAAGAFGVAMLFRYEYVLFLAPLLGLTILTQAGSSSLSRRIFWLGVVSLVVVAVFVIPVLVLNQYVYGDWRTYGYSLFNDAYYPDSGGSHSGVTSSLLAVLLPSAVSLESVGRNLLRFTLMLTPGLSLLAIAGAWLVVKEGRIRLRSLAGICGLVVFFVCYRGSSDTWGATGMSPTFDAAIVRYWLPLYVALVLLAAFALAQIHDTLLKMTLVTAIAATSTMTLMWSYDGNLTALANGLQNQERWSQDVLPRVTEDDAVIYAGRSDKRIVPYRYTAAWWNGAEFYSPKEVARSMSRVFSARHPVYIRREPEVAVDELNAALAIYLLQTAPTSDKSLLKVEPLRLAP